MLHHRRRAFTLIEVLVVVAIVAILLAIVFAVMSSSRDSAFRADETSRLRQLYVAVNLYEEDYDRKSPMSIVDLVPEYVSLDYLKNPLDARANLSLPDWPANPWVNGRLVDRPEVMRQRSAGMVSYFYINSFSARFPPGRTMEFFRNEPTVGMITGVGLMKCDSSLGFAGCSYPEQDPFVDKGQPAINLAGTLLTVRMDGSIATRRRPSPVASTMSYEQLFLFTPMKSTWQPIGSN